MGKRNFLMKKLLLPVFILALLNAYAQSPIESVSKTYFRTQPFGIRFSSFVTSLQKDPWFTQEAYHRRTDSSFFFLSGTYKNFNPFHYIPKELRLVIAEDEIIHRDSLTTHDTIINLQIMGVTDTGIIDQRAVEKEFKRFHSNKGRQFTTTTHEIFKGVGEAYNYFVSPFSISPVTVAWGRLETNQYTFVITIRFKLRENSATYIVAPGEF
jgi:hypothetical protein